MEEINLDFAFDLHFEILLRRFRGLCGHPDNKKAVPKGRLFLPPAIAIELQRLTL